MIHCLCKMYCLAHNYVVYNTALFCVLNILIVIMCLCNALCCMPLLGEWLSMQWTPNPSSGKTLLCFTLVDWKCIWRILCTTIIRNSCGWVHLIWPHIQNGIECRVLENWWEMGFPIGFKFLCNEWARSSCDMALYSMDLFWAVQSSTWATATMSFIPREKIWKKLLLITVAIFVSKSNKFLVRKQRLHLIFSIQKLELLKHCLKDILTIMSA